MIDWLMVAVVGAGMLYLLGRLNIYLQLTVFRSDGDDFVGIRVYVLRGILLYSMKVSIIELVSQSAVPWLESKIETSHGKTQTHSRREQRFVKRLLKLGVEHPRKIQQFFRNLWYKQQRYCRFMHKIIQSVCCEKFYWRTTFGFEDAAATAMTTGVLWSSKALVLTFLQKRTRFTADAVMKVQPVFGQNKLELDFQCIFSIRLGNLINAVTSAIYDKKQGGAA